MGIKDLVSKYIDSTENLLKKVEIAEGPVTVESQCIAKVHDYVKAYLKDARYYRDKRRFDVALASVAYCEGLLDALKLLGTVRTERSSPST